MIGISDEHVELAATVRKWAEAAGALDAVRAAELDPASLRDWPARWADLGLAAVALPEPLGGGTLLDQAVALEAAAQALVPGPLLGTTAAGLVVTDEELRAGIAAGSVGVGVQIGDVVLDAPSATHLLLRQGDGWTLLPAADAAVEPGAGPDLSRTVGRATGTGRAVEVDGDELRRLLLVLASAEASGVARWCLETAVEYAKVREQFGRPIGSFQAVKHLCAQMLETTECVTAAAWDAATAGPGQQGRFAALVAATTCLDGAVAVAEDCIQVLGGIGFTFEHDAHLYLRRALSLRALLGAGGRHAVPLARLAASGVRRSTRIDLDGRDADLREEVRATVARIAAAEDRRAALVESRYLAPHWPAPHGLGADPVLQLVIDEELAGAAVERPDLKIGAWAVPTILAHGTTGQQERFVGPTLRGEVTWCQLFSEPGAGSDLASLRTRAERVTSGWSLTGQKVWTSLAHEADWAICLARTSSEGRPHAGITYFLVDMRSPGIEIRPLRELTGEAMFNEVFLDGVFVPDECVVGEVGGGWKLARTTLANERVAMAGSRLGVSVERALELDGDSEAVGRAVALATVVKLLGNRATLRSLVGRGPGARRQAESSVAKLVGVRSRQDAAELVVDLLGQQALLDQQMAHEAMHELLLTRCLSIAGGTTQVLRNVAAERVLGLPR
ncbi:MAG TPA: acyl-CoA dehydrogenase [Marmoricola sp.]|nr:acyl-CoA dehydrogenase [Marmoricola sp.]